MTVNKARVQKFVEALRSGEYTQGRDALAKVTPDGKTEFCCLGVACEVAMKDGLSLDKQTYPGVLGRGTRYMYDASTGYLPALVQDYYGFGDRDPELGDYSATHYNDTIKFNFARIADLFEQTYLTEEAEANDSE